MSIARTAVAGTSGAASRHRPCPCPRVLAERHKYRRRPHPLERDAHLCMLAREYQFPTLDFGLVHARAILADYASYVTKREERSAPHLVQNASPGVILPPHLAHDAGSAAGSWRGVASSAWLGRAERCGT